MFCANFENVANSQQRRDSNGAARLDLLPVAGREPERNHVLLGVPPRLPEFLGSLSEGVQELGVVDHASLCNGTRAEISRAD